MALIACPECKKEISDTTDSCPNCGYKHTTEIVAKKKKKEKQVETGCGIGCLAVIVILAIIGYFSSNSQRTETSTPSDSSVLERRISGDYRFGCVEREYFDNLVGYSAQKDNEAFTKALTSGLLTGACTTFKNSEVVYINDTAIFSGIIKVRRKEETKEYWTNIEAVK